MVEHGNEQDRHHQVLAKGSVHPVHVVELIRHEEHGAETRRQGEAEHQVEDALGDRGELTRAKAQRSIQDHGIAEQPDDVDEALDGTMRMDWKR